MDKNTRILLISVQVDLTIMGLKQLHYYLLQNHFDSRLLALPEFNPSHRAGLETLRQFVSEFNPAMIGVSLMTGEFARARELSLFLKKNFFGLPILWGGIHPTVAPESCFPYADYVCVGEGFKSLRDFAEAASTGADPRGINNLCHQGDGQMQRNPLYPLIENIDEIPSGDHLPRQTLVQTGNGRIRELDREMFRRYGRYQDRFYDTVTSLGCQLSCTYCTSPFLSRLYGNHRVRKRSLENIMEELERAVRDYPFLEMVNFHDENFLSYDLEFIKRFRDEYRAKIHRPFMFFGTPLWVTREKIALLREAGLNWARMGLQSGSDRALRDIYHRKSLTGHLREAMQICQELGVAVYCDVILDNPLESDQDRLQTVKVLAEAPRPFYLAMYSLTVYFGTQLYEMIKQQCPEKLVDPREKAFFIYERTILNNLIRIAPYAPRPVLAGLLRLYDRNPNGALLRILLALTKFISVSLIEPLTLFRVFRISQGGSTIRVLKMIPIYRRIFLQRYVPHFQRHS